MSTTELRGRLDVLLYHWHNQPIAPVETARLWLEIQTVTQELRRRRT